MPYLKYLLIGLLCVIFVYGLGITSIPKDFPINQTFLIEENESLKSVSLKLEENHIINSALWFRAFASFLGKDKHMQLGIYKFDKPIVLGSVVKRIFDTGPNEPLVKVTIPEGNTDNDIAKKINEKFPDIGLQSFLNKISELKASGKLFPETYFFLPSYNEDKIINKMMDLFDKKYQENFATTTIPNILKNENEVIILASIIEGEAKSKEDMQIVSGILQKRLKGKMALQVDVSPITYRQRGLPNTPVNNPGINSLYAVFHPINTDYLYYITGSDGKMYYSKTFAEHKENIAKYLR